MRIQLEITPDEIKAWCFYEEKQLTSSVEHPGRANEANAISLVVNTVRSKFTEMELKALIDSGPMFTIRETE